MKFAHLLGVALLACGCAGMSPYTPIGTQRADHSYRKVDLPFSTTLGGRSTVSFFIKPFDSGGDLGLCGYYLATLSYSDSQLLRDVLSSRDSRLTIGQTLVGDMSFPMANDRHFDEADASAYCVHTATKWDSAFLTARIRIQTPGHTGRY